MATIADVANEAKVSTATVSRVLNGKYYVTEEKRQRVLAAIEKVGYQLPARVHTARADTDGKSLVLIICGNLVTPLVEAVQKYASAAGYHVVVTHYDHKAEFAHISGLVERLTPLLAGVILLNSADNSREFQALIEPFPLVQIGEPIMERVPNLVVYNDEIRMAEEATDYLLDHGCHRIGLLTSETNNTTALFRSNKRKKGFFLALLNRGLRVDESWVQHEDISIDGGYEGTKLLMERHPDLDGIICVTDKVSQGAIYAIRRAGKTTDQIRVFSMDSSEIWDFDNDRLPYLDPHHDEMAESAVFVLNAAIAGEINRDRDHRVIINHTLHLTRAPATEPVQEPDSGLSDAEE